MKTLKKLQINSEKLMKNEELLTLRGGEWCGAIYVDCPDISFSGPACGDSPEAAVAVCMSIWGEVCTCRAYNY